MKSMILVASMLMSSIAFAATPTTTPASTASAAVAASTPRTLTAQQQKMVDCNKQATGKKGADRKTFMSTCLKKAPIAASTPAVATPASAASTTAVKK